MDRLKDLNDTHPSEDVASLAGHLLATLSDVPAAADSTPSRPAAAPAAPPTQRKAARQDGDVI